MRASVLLLTLLTGCAVPPGGWDSPEPAARLCAITQAARTQDRAAIPHLIESLNSDDPVVRMAAIRTLQQLTGQTLGYDYAAPEWDRQDKIAAWVAWYRRQSPESSTPGARGSGSGPAAGSIQWG